MCIRDRSTSPHSAGTIRARCIPLSFISPSALFLYPLPPPHYHPFCFIPYQTPPTLIIITNFYHTSSSQEIYRPMMTGRVTLLNPSHRFACFLASATYLLSSTAQFRINLLASDRTTCTHVFQNVSFIFLLRVINFL